MEEDEAMDENDKKPCGSRYPTWQWLVGVFVLLISFLLVRGLDTYSDRILNQENASKQMLSKTEVINERLVRLEANYGHIMEGISELKRNQDKFFGMVLEKPRVVVKGQ